LGRCCPEASGEKFWLILSHTTHSQTVSKHMILKILAIILTFTWLPLSYFLVKYREYTIESSKEKLFIKKSPIETIRFVILGIFICFLVLVFSLGTNYKMDWSFGIFILVSVAVIIMSTFAIKLYLNKKDSTFDFIKSKLTYDTETQYELKEINEIEHHLGGQKTDDFIVVVLKDGEKLTLLKCRRKEPIKIVLEQLKKMLDIKIVEVNTRYVFGKKIVNRN